MKRFVLLFLFLFSLSQLFAQTQYDYYDDVAPYSGVESVFTELIIVGVIVLLALVFFLILSIYGLFAGWYREDNIKSHENLVAQKQEDTDVWKDVQMLSQYEKDVSEKELLDGIEDAFGVVYSADYTQLLKCKNDKINKYKIDYRCKIIRNRAFYICKKLSDVYFPQGVVFIGRLAFHECGFSQLLLPNSILYIADMSFADCPLLAYVKQSDNIVHIGKKAFAQCERLTTINIPRSVNFIGENAFAGTSIKNVVCESSLFLFETGLLINNEEKSLISFWGDTDNVIIPRGVTRINDCVFENCKKLSIIVIPSTVTHIGNYAFYNCSSLSSVCIPNDLEYIGRGSFEYCKQLSRIDLPNGILYLGDEAFKGCEKLSSINLPDSINYIGNGAFQNCTSLSDVVLPNDLTIINNHTFSNCCNLKMVKLPLALKHIGGYAFEYCKVLEDIVLPQNLIDIGEAAFLCCKKLSAINFPEGLTKIGNEAFHFCSKIIEMTLPSELKHIGDKAFVGTGIRHVNSKSPLFEFKKGCLIDVQNNKINAYLSDEKMVEIPRGITHIGCGAFIESSITDIVLPYGLTHIESWTFAWCRCLDEVKLPDSVLYIGDEAFTVCDRLKSINLPRGLKYLGRKNFTLCNNLSKIHIPKGTKSYFTDMLPSEMHDKLIEDDGI